MGGIDIMDSTYFNADFKEKYLKDSETRNLYIRKTVDLLFRRIAPTEIRLNKDLYDFSVAEIIGYYKYLQTSSFESLMVMNNQYKLYTEYAKKCGIVKDNQNHYAEIDNKTLLACIHIGLAKAKVIIRKNLLEILESSAVENVSDKVICLALFEGIGGRELTELTHLEPTDFNTKTQIVNLYGGRKLKLSEKLIDWCLESADEYKYFNSLSVKGNKSYLKTDTRVIKRISNSTVDNDLQRHKTINRRLDHLIDITGCNALSVGALRESGRLEMIKTLMENGKSLNEALNDKDMIYRYGNIPSHKRYCLKYGLD